ncbi:MAG: carbohydrate ABC transporter permease [Albidovulum sp.]|nr:carbohydrate ABC transporter permease [Albidovulum sp.]
MIFLRIRVRRAILRSLLIYCSAAIVLFVMAFPLFGLLLTSLQPEAVIRSRDVQFVPETLHLEHFAEVLAPGHIAQVREAMLNSFIVSILTAIVCLVIALPAAYAISRFRLPGRLVLLGAMISVYFLPTTLFLIPMFVLFVSWGIDDSFLSLIIPYSGFILPFEIWILKAFIDKLPSDIEDAARVDGCSDLQVMMRVVLPLVRPGLLAGFIFAFILSWIEFLTPLIFTSDLKISTVALGMFRSTIDIKVGQQAAAAVLTLLPVAFLMLVFQGLISRVLLGAGDR